MGKSGFSVKINLNSREFNKKLNDVSNRLKRAFGGSWITVSDKLAGKLHYFAISFGLVAAGAMKMGAELEQQQVAFTRMLGSVDAATQKLRSLQDFASRTPFRFSELVEYEKRLIAMGFSAQHTETLLTSLGDAVSGLGMGSDGLNRLIKAFSDIKAKGVLQTQEMRQLAEAGIPAWEMISKKMGISIQETMKLVEDRAISSADSISIIIEGLNSRFSGMMSKQSKTMIGLASNIRGEIESIAMFVGQTINNLPGIKEFLSSFLTELQSLRREISIIGVSDVFSSLLSGKLGAAISGISAIMTTLLIPAVGKLALALWPFKGIMAVLGLAGLAGSY